MKYLLSLGMLLGIGLLAGERLENGNVPKGESKTLTFTEDWRVSPENGENHFLWNGSNVTAVFNKAGHSYVLDAGNNRVIQLDENGAFVRQIGREGGGPGEFRKPTNISLLADQNFIVSEYQVGLNIMSVFDRDGTFIRRLDTARKGKFLLQSYFTPDGKKIGATYLFRKEGGPQLYMSYGVLDLDFKAMLELETNPMPTFQPNRAADPAHWVEFLSPWFSLIPHQGLIAFADDGTIYTGKGDRYEITRYSPDLTEKLLFSRKYKPKSQSIEDINQLSEPVRNEVLGSLPGSLHPYITDSVVSKSIEKAGFPEVRSAIFGIIPMEEGGVMVIHDYDPKTGKAQSDLFNARGEYIGFGPMPPADFNVFGGYFGCTAKMWFRNGKLYLIGSDEGDYYLSCNSYKIK